MSRCWRLRLLRRTVCASSRAAIAWRAAFVLVLIVAAVISIRQSIRANRESAIAQAVNDFLRNDLLAQAGPDNQIGPDSKPDPDLKVRTVLDRAGQRITGKFDQQPEVEAAIRETIGSSYLDLGLKPQAIPQLQQVLALDLRTLGEKDPKTIATMSSLGSALSATLVGRDESGVLKAGQEGWSRQRGGGRTPTDPEFRDQPPRARPPAPHHASVHDEPGLVLRWSE